MKQPRPIGIIKKQSLTTPPFISDSTLVDDTVALVDSSTALSGGPTSIYPGIKANTSTQRYFTKVKKRR